MKTIILKKFNNALEEVRKNSTVYSEILNNSTNLKLYEVAGIKDLDDSSFSSFCEDSYNEFEFQMDELGIEREYIGSTSTFYFNSRYFDMYQYDYQGLMNSKKIIYLICEHSGIDTDYITIDEDGLISDLKDVKLSDGSLLSWEEYFLENFEIDTDYITIDEDGLTSDLNDVELSDGSLLSWEKYLLENVTLEAYIEDLKDSKDSFLEEIESIRKGYEYIDVFKENQVKIFKEWQEC